MHLKNRKLPPLSPLSTEILISNTPNQFADLRIKVALIEKCKTSLSIVDLNSTISQLRDMYKSDSYEFSVIDTSNSAKKKQLSQYQNDLDLLEQKYNKLKNYSNIQNILESQDLTPTISNLEKSIHELENNNLIEALPKMTDFVKNSFSNKSTKYLNLIDYHYKLLENSIYSLNKRIVTIDQSDTDIDKVNKLYGSLKNLLEKYHHLQNENTTLKSEEKKYFSNRFIRRYPLTKLTALCNKLLAEATQYYFLKEVSISESFQVEYDKNKGLDASTFLKEEKQPNDLLIDKMKNEIDLLINNRKKYATNYSELDFNQLVNRQNKIESIDHQCIEILLQIKKIIKEKEMYTKTVNSIENKIRDIYELDGIINFMKHHNYYITKSLFYSAATFGLSLIFNLEKNNICEKVFRWLSQNMNNGVILNTEVSDGNGSDEDEPIDFMTRPTSTISPLAKSYLNDNFLRNVIKHPNEKHHGIQMLNDGVICEFLSALDIVINIGKNMKFITSDKNAIALNYFKNELSNLSAKMRVPIDEINALYSNSINLLQHLCTGMLVKEHTTKGIQATPVLWRNSECQVLIEPQNEKAKKKK